MTLKRRSPVFGVTDTTFTQSLTLFRPFTRRRDDGLEAEGGSETPLF